MDHSFQSVDQPTPSSSKTRAINSQWSLSIDSQHHSAIYWQNKCYGNILLFKTSVISMLVGHFDCKHRCIVEKNVPIAFILPSRWRDGAESLWLETTRCLCKSRYVNRAHYQIQLMGKHKLWQSISWLFCRNLKLWLILKVLETFWRVHLPPCKD